MEAIQFTRTDKVNVNGFPVFERSGELPKGTRFVMLSYSKNGIWKPGFRMGYRSALDLIEQGEAQGKLPGEVYRLIPAAPTMDEQAKERLRVLVESRKTVEGT